MYILLLYIDLLIYIYYLSLWFLEDTKKLAQNVFLCLCEFHRTNSGAIHGTHFIAEIQPIGLVSLRVCSDRKGGKELEGW